MPRDMAGEALRDAHQRCTHLEAMVRRLADLARKVGATDQQIASAIIPQQ